MITPLDKLIKGLENRQRIQAQAAIPLVLLLEQAAPYVISAAVAALTSIGLISAANKLSAFSPGTALALTPEEENDIRWALIEKMGMENQAGLATFDAANAGLSFVADVAPALDFATWEQAVAQAGSLGEGRRDTIARMAYQASPQDPCGWLRDQWRDAKGRLDAERLKGFSDARNAVGRELQDIAAAGKAYCVDGEWTGPTSGLDIRVVSKRSGGTPPSSEPGVQEFKVSRPSPLGNPFELKNIYDDVERARVIEQYRSWLSPQVDRYLATGETTPAVEELLRISRAAPGGRVELVCWCSPRACHGDVVAQMVETILRAGGVI